jgi:hypothetical protein
MAEPLRQFTQREYTRVLDECGARVRGLGQTECENILMEHGASYLRARNGAYVYLHHGDHMLPTDRGSQDEYNQLLDEFGATEKAPMDCIKYLESLGRSYGQAKSAVYNYRVKKGLIGRR